MLFWKNIKDFLHSYSYTKGQFFLISFPKTGRTWLMYMIDQLQLISNNNSRIDKFFLLNEHDNSEIIIENGYRNNPLDIFKFASRYKYKRAKVIFLVRDPRDVVVSHFHQITKRSVNPFIFENISEFIRDEVLGFNRIIHYYNLWYNNRNIPEEFLLVRYEDLLQNGVVELLRIDSFLKLNICDSKVKSVYNNSSADKMRKKEVNNQFDDFNNFGKEKNQMKVRNAVSGGYLNELDEEDILYCNKIMKDLNPYFNYNI